MARSLIARARFVDVDGASLPLAVLVGYTETDGDHKTLAQGKSRDDGTLELKVELPRGGRTILPSLVLLDEAGQVLAQIATYTEGVLDFGTVQVWPKAPASVAGSPVRGLPVELLAALELVDPAEVEALEARLTEAVVLLKHQATLLAESEARAETLSRELVAAEDRAKVSESKASKAEQTLKHSEETVKTYESGEARLQYVVRAIGSQLDQARAELDDSGGRYKVNKVSATLKVVPDATGSLFSFPSPDKVTDTASLSELVIELEEGLPDRAPVEPAGLVSPDLSGLTKVAIERVLRATGLTGAYVSETVSDETQVGRCVRQVPEAGASTTRGAVVAVYLGKALQTAASSAASEAVRS